MIFQPLTITIAGLILTLWCIPLALGKIGPNFFYGIRTRAAYASEENWYRINRFGGKIFLSISCIMTLIGLAGFFVPVEYLAVYDAAALIIFTISSFVATAMVVLAK